MPAGTIRKREAKQGTRWQAIVDLGPDLVTGKRRQRSKFCDTEREAKRALAQLLVQADRGLLSARTGQTVAALCQQWLDTDACFKAPKTFEEYERTIRLHVTPHLGKIKAHSLSTPLGTLYGHQRPAESRKWLPHGPALSGRASTRCSPVQQQTAFSPRNADVWCPLPAPERIAAVTWFDLDGR